MEGYGALAGSYDGFTRDVDYPRWADYVEKQFQRAKKPVHTVLDLACGTGSLTWLLARRGYEMIGVDLSPEMLSQAMEKEEDEEIIPPVFLCQPMECLDLYGTVDACICALDSVNHVTRSKTLGEAFRRVALFLEPGGLFLFDVLTPAYFEALDGQVFLDETQEAFCVWRAQYAPRRQLCTYAMDLFQREGALWQREETLQQERAYTQEEICALLEEAGFCRIRSHGNLKMSAPKPGEGRLFFTAWKRG